MSIHCWGDDALCRSLWGRLRITCHVCEFWFYYIRIPALQDLSAGYIFIKIVEKNERLTLTFLENDMGDLAIKYIMRCGLTCSILMSFAWWVAMCHTNLKGWAIFWGWLLLNLVKFCSIFCPRPALAVAWCTIQLKCNAMFH